MIEFCKPFAANLPTAERDVWITKCHKGRLEHHKSRFEDRDYWYAMKITEGGWRNIESFRTYRDRPAAEKILFRHLDGKPPLKRATKASRAIARRKKR